MPGVHVAQHPDSEVIIRVLNIARICQTSGSVAILYDHVITLDQEVNHVWKRPFSFGSVNYFVIRYIGDAMAILNLINFWGQGVQTVIVFVQGKIYFLFLTWLFVLMTFLVELVLQARIYALYQQSRVILVIMVFVCVAQVAAMATIMGFLDMYWHITNETLGSYICADEKAPSFYRLYIFWLPTIVGDSVLCLLALWHGIRTWMSGYRIRGKNRVFLAEILVKGNVGYFLCVILITLANIIIGQYLGVTWANVSEAFPSPMQVVIGCRLILNLRSTLARNTEEDILTRDLNTACFALPDIHSRATLTP